MDVEWIIRLAMAFNFTANKTLIEEYLENLSTWNLTTDQWHRVKFRAKDRFEFFPKICQLTEIAQEVLAEDFSRQAVDEIGSDPRPPAGCEWARDEAGEIVHPMRAIRQKEAQ